MVDYCTFSMENEIPKTQEYPNFKNKIQSSSSSFNYPKQDILTTSAKEVYSFPELHRSCKSHGLKERTMLNKTTRYADCTQTESSSHQHFH